MTQAPKQTEIPKPAPLPRDVNAALKTVIGTVSGMNAIYTEETAALDALDTPRFLALQPTKIERATHYHAHITEMLSRKEELHKADPRLKSALRNLYAAFDDLSKRNLEALDRMKHGTERLGQTIRNAAVNAAKSQRNLSYGESGTLSNSIKNKVISTGLSETA